MSLIMTATEAWQDNQSLITWVHGFNIVFVSIKFIVALFGSLTILVGASLAAYRYFLYRVFCSISYTLSDIRLDLAKTIILALEFFVASDVIETMIAPDFYSLGVLAILVLIRTALNFSMQREISTLSQKNNSK